MAKKTINVNQLDTIIANYYGLNRVTIQKVEIGDNIEEEILDVGVGGVCNITIDYDPIYCEKCGKEVNRKTSYCDDDGERYCRRCDSVPIKRRK